jgi:hypothetical protein
MNLGVAAEVVMLLILPIYHQDKGRRYLQRI